jgi:hypothetical protein
MAFDPIPAPSLQKGDRVLTDTGHGAQVVHKVRTRSGWEVEFRMYEGPHRGASFTHTIPDSARVKRP